MFEDWPEAPVQLKARVDLQGISIETYRVETLGGRVSGSGQIDYGAGLMYEISESIVLDFPVRFNTVFSDPDTVNFVSVTGGIAIFF